LQLFSAASYEKIASHLTKEKIPEFVVALSSIPEHTTREQ
jgi:hypothetical protein